MINMDELTLINYDDKVALIDGENHVCISMPNKYILDRKYHNYLSELLDREREFQRARHHGMGNVNTIYIVLTRKCNMNCIYCSMRANENLVLKDEFNIDIFTRNLLPFLKAMEPRKIIITGGEPLLKKDLINMIIMIKKEMVTKVVLQTNGLLFDKNIAIKLSQYVDEIDFSTGHMLNNNENKMKLIQNLDLCNEFIKSTVLTFLYDSTNKSELYELIDLAVKYDVSIIINHIAPIGRAVDNKLYINNDSSIKDMYIDIAKYMISKNYDEKHVVDLLAFNVDIRKECSGYGKMLSIYPEGNIYMCQCLEDEVNLIGNINTDPTSKIMINWKQLLQSHKIKELFCVDFKVKCKNCNYKYLCGGGCGASDLHGKEKDCSFIIAFINYWLFIYNKKDNNRNNILNFIKHLENSEENI